MEVWLTKKTHRSNRVDWLVGWLVGWLIGWLVGWLVGFGLRFVVDIFGCFFWVIIFSAVFSRGSFFYRKLSQ